MAISSKRTLNVSNGYLKKPAQGRAGEKGSDSNPEFLPPADFMR
jgi:hypothetical protein